MRIVAFSLFLLLSAVCAPVLAQTAPLDEKQKAVMVFDVRLDKIRNCELGKKLNLAEKLTEMQAMSGDDGPELSTIDQIFGAMSAPENVAAASTIQMGQLPMDFFVQINFNDEVSVEDIMEKVEEENGGTVEHDGSTFYKMPADAGAPEGIMMRKISAKSVEMGTEAYLFQKNRTPFSTNLKAAWDGAPKGAVRIVMDLDGAKGLISEAVEMGKQNAPDPMVGVYMDLVDNMKDLAICLDLAGGDLLTLKATGVNEADATELKEGLDSLLGMAKMGIKSQLPMIRGQDPEGADVMEKLAGSLEAASTGSTVSVTIPTPAGFDEWVIKQVAQLEQMMGGLAPRN